MSATQIVEIYINFNLLFSSSHLLRQRWWRPLMMKILWGLFDLNSQIMALRIWLIGVKLIGFEGTVSRIVMWEYWIWPVRVGSHHWFQRGTRMRRVSLLLSYVYLGSLMEMRLCLSVICSSDIKFAFQILYLILEWLQLGLHDFSRLLYVYILLNQILARSFEFSAICGHRSGHLLMTAVVWEHVAHHFRGRFHQVGNVLNSLSTLLNQNVRIWSLLLGIKYLIIVKGKFIIRTLR